MIKLDESKPLSWFGKGLALGILGRNEEALAAFSKAVELAPEQAHFWHLKGAIHLRISLREFNKSNYGNALENLNSALEAFNAFSTYSKSEESKKKGQQRSYGIYDEAD